MVNVRASWTAAKEEAMLTVLVEAIADGELGDNGFRKPCWTRAVDAVNSVPPLTKYNTDVLKNRFHTFKAEYNRWKTLKEHTGLGRDKDTGAITADDEFWEREIASRPQNAIYKHRPINHEEFLDVVFSGKIPNRDLVDGFLRSLQ